MSKIRVLVVDDSVVVRRMVTTVLDSDPDIEVVGVAANGKIALAKIPQVNPDLLTLDIEMPEMDGLATLGALRKDYLRLPVIMFSTLTERGASATLEALTLGANDYVTKPSNVGSVKEGQDRIREQLIPKIKGLCPDKIGEAALESIPIRSIAKASAQTPALSASNETAEPRLLVIGVSTGGPNALAELMPALPADLPVPILIVQHMPPLFTRLLAERLDAKCALKVGEARGGETPRPGEVWIAPGAHHMILKRDGAQLKIELHQEPPENSCRPAVDPLFRSAAKVHGAHVLGVVLTGMGQDGCRGCEALKAAGGRVLIQDAETSVVWGMPGYVAEAGLADAVVPLPEMAGAIVRRIVGNKAQHAWGT